MKIRVEVSSLATPRPSGVANYTRLLTEALAAHQDTEVYGSYFNFLNRQPEPNLSQAIYVDKNSFVPLRVYAKLQSYNLAPAFDMFKPSVDLTIHPNFATWPTIKSQKVATVIHDLTYLYYPELVETKNLSHLRRVVPRSVEQADFIITVSKAIRDEIVNEFNIDPDKCVVTNIPPSEDFYSEGKADVHSRYNIATKKYILFVGNLEPRKNLSTLVKAYQLLPEVIRREYSLVIGGGKGWKFEQTQALIDSHDQNSGRIQQIGFVDQADLPSLFQQASLFVMPSRYEGFGMPMVEALVSKCRVVASDIAVLRESGGEAALYADVDSPTDFADKIKKSLGQDFDNQAAKRHLAKISWSKNAQAIIDKASIGT